MLFIKKLFSLNQNSWEIAQHLLLPTLLGLTLSLFQNPVSALQMESVAMRNMSAYKKFDGLSQNAFVIKTKATQVKYVDHIEFASGELANDEDNSFFVSAGPAWRFNKRIAQSGLAFVEFGTSPTWISNNQFGDESLGGHIFFTSNIQIGMHFGFRRELTLALRVHHISNGGLGSKNPGTDMVGLEMTYLFKR